MPTLESLEQKFLTAVPVVPFETADLKAEQSADTVLSPDAVRSDIATFAQMLINVYGGWPFYPKLLRLKIMNKLSRLYDSITAPVTVGALHEMLRPIIEIMPDNHLWVKLNNNLSKYTHKDEPTAGQNIITKRGIADACFMEKQDNVGIIAISHFFEFKSDDIRQHFCNSLQSMMDGTRAIIIDLRGNGGGKPMLSELIPKTLLGIDIPHSLRMYRRTTPQGLALYKNSSLPTENPDADMSVDPVLWADNSDFKIPRNHVWAYNNPIYILIDNYVASSAERLITRMRFNPNVTLVGTHTLGCLQYTNYMYLLLKNSGLVVQLPTVYKEVPDIKRFETNGYVPDIECSGQDAFDVAMTHLNQRTKNIIMANSQNTQGQ